MSPIHSGMADALKNVSSVSIVIPVWNEAPRNLWELCERLHKTMEGLGGAWEIIFVDDRSREAVRGTLREISDKDSRVRRVLLERRCGQETALMIGMSEARGELICTMDCDLQNRPEDLPQMLASFGQGADLVLGKRKSTPGCPLLRRVLSRICDYLMNWRWGIVLSDWGCGFNVIRRGVFKRVLNDLVQGTKRPIKVLCISHSGQWVEIEVTQAPRRYGRSGYSIGLYCKHAWKLLTEGNTIVPLGPEVKARLRPPIKPR